MAGKDARVTFIEMARFSFSMGMSQPTLDPFSPVRLRVRLAWYTLARTGLSACAQKMRRMAIGAYFYTTSKMLLAKNPAWFSHVALAHR
eukprot:scaffold17428_cov94-Isochrysis_galbana.AAC.1